MNGHFTAVAAARSALTFLYSFDPALTAGGLLPPCPFRLVTGLLCPLCGTLRAAHALLHGHLAAASHYNTLAMGSGTVLMTAAAASRVSSSMVGRLIAGLTSRLALSSIVLAAVAFLVARNAPASFLP